MRLRPPAIRIFGALAIALVLVVSFARSVHEAVVPHSICAEHGESVELAPGTGAPALPADAHHPHRESTDPRVVDSPENRAEDHEHCDLAVLGRTKELFQQQPAQAPAATSAPRVLAQHGTASGELSVPLLLLAPKHSPPARA